MGDTTVSPGAGHRGALLRRIVAPSNSGSLLPCVVRGWPDPCAEGGGDAYYPLDPIHDHGANENYDESIMRLSFCPYPYLRDLQPMLWS